MKIIIVDDDKLVATSLKTIISASNDIEVFALGENAEQAVTLYQEYQPDVLLMDIRMGEKTGLDAGKEILKTHPNAKILYLTTFADDEYIITALKIGAKGYILKQNYESIIPALHAVFMGQTVFGEEIVLKLPNILNGSSDKKDIKQYDLLPKEVELIELVAKGLSNKEISSQLFLSEGTVRNYMSSILEKLELRDRTQLAIFYYNKMQS